MSKNKLGLLFGVSAYSLWGAFPLYWPLLEPANPLEIVSHRAVWTLVFCFIVLAATKALKSTLVTLKRPTVAIKLFLSSLLISINWLVYIWATNNEHVVEASLGYYINPLIIIGFGVIFLKEKMRSLQWAAVAIASIGVLVLTFDYGRLPWIALALAVSWGSYGLIKKQLGLGALEGLTIETLISSVFYLAYLIYLGNQGVGQFGQSWGLTVLLISAGAVTAIPLLLFNGSTNRLPFTTIGLLQYITPTLQFSIGVWVLNEDMPTARWIGFLIIWAALVTLAIDLIKSSRTVNNGVA
ncbi:MAG: permease [Actinobacteria bacterium BACL15 MAG-120619-bin91]|uniref:Permease n=2 Tax=ac1 cluster TaxID=1655545 RepID=A0A0R2PH05_9ACTN|nr:MAG: permease [Actinobacteria bacterium BACL15 MAG-120619-bin91]KRO37288.1 MAG: permease [Actinobacteria bacterium BACL15 MAG-120823-bin78]MDP5051667.1 EamA family transporter RarD [Candidatus Planktophila sp.]